MTEQAGADRAGVFLRRGGLLWPPALVAIVAASTLIALPDPFTWPARIGTAVPIMALLTLAVRRGWLRRHLPVRALRPAGAGATEVGATRVGAGDAGAGRVGADRGPGGASRQFTGVGAAVWVTLIAAAAALQLFNCFAEPRDVYPTLSSILSEVLPIYPVRAGLVALWIWVGWYLVDR